MSKHNDLIPFLDKIPLFYLNSWKDFLQEDIGCSGCGVCCKEEQVFIPLLEFTVIQSYLRKNDIRLSLNNKDDSCIFLGKHGCMIHAVRPIICRVYGPCNVREFDDGFVSAHHLCYPGGCNKTKQKNRVLNEELWGTYLSSYSFGAVLVHSGKQNHPGLKALTSHKASIHNGQLICEQINSMEKYIDTFFSINSARFAERQTLNSSN